MSKEIDLSRKTITEDENGNASITGKVSTEGAIVDAKDLTTKEYVDNAIAQASIGGEVDTSGFALKTELPTKTSQLTNDSGFMTSIPDEYVTNSELEQTLIPYGQELDKKSNIINYSDHTLNEVETYNNLEKLSTSETSGLDALYIIDKSINLTKGSICSIEVKFSDNTNLLLQGEVASSVLTQKEVNYIQIMGQTGNSMGVMLMDKAKYSISDNDSLIPEHNDNASTLMVLHPNANNVISLIITKPTTFEINNSFFMNYQFVNEVEKENWNNKADKSELVGLASELYVDNAMAELREEMVILEEDDLTIDGLVDESFPSLTTEDKTLIGAINEINSENESLQNQINELFQNVSNGKELIASAITDKGVDASEEETFQSLSEKINQIPVGPPGSNIIGYINENNDIYVSLTELESGTYTLKFEDYTGLLNEFDDIGTVEV